MSQTIPEAPLRRFTVGEYLQMAESGLFGLEPKVELVEGYIVQKMTQKPPHMIACSLLLDALKVALPPGWFLSMQGPIELPESLPEPDAAVVRGHQRLYADRRWGAGDVGLLVEVSDSSLALDQGAKQRVYSRAGVPIFWIVNLVDRCVTVYEDPGGDEYARQQRYAPRQRVPLVLDGVPVARIAVSDLLP